MPVGAQQSISIADFLHAGGKAKEVIGVEPNPDMRKVALEKSEPNEKGTDIRYVDGHSADTTLTQNTADIVCCSQSFHWMEPNSTLSEVNRILKTGGLIAPIDCDWPPVINPQAEQAYRNTIAKIKSLERNQNRPQPIQRWSKDKHLVNIQSCGYFKYVREICMHRMETGTADRLVGLLLSQGGVEFLLKAGITEEELGITEFRALCREIPGDSPKPWYFSYRVRIGVK